MPFVTHRNGTYRRFVLLILNVESECPLKPSGHYMYRTVVTICTTSLIFTNSRFCPHSVFMCFVWISEQTAIISLYNINWLVCITETNSVYCAVRTGSFKYNAIFSGLYSHKQNYAARRLHVLATRVCAAKYGQQMAAIIGSVHLSRDSSQYTCR